MSTTEVTSTAAHLAGLEQRVTGLEKGLRDVASSITALAGDIRQGQKTQWPIIWQAMAVAVTILAGLGALAYVPVRSDQEKLERVTDRITDNLVPRTEVELYRRLSELKQREAEGRIEARIDKLEKRAYGIGN